jgi:ketosteroid isomerase-like protein
MRRVTSRVRTITESPRSCAVALDARAVFAEIDAMDPDAFVAHFAEDGVMRFGNADPITGRDNIRQALSDFFGAIDGLTHHVLDTWQVADTLLARTEVEYLRKDGRRTPRIPNADIATLNGDQITSWLIYIDLAPLFAP